MDDFRMPGDGSFSLGSRTWPGLSKLVEECGEVLQIAEDYGLDLEQVVRPLADLLGPNEDFDGLVSALEDEASK